MMFRNFLAQFDCIEARIFGGCVLVWAVFTALLFGLNL